MIDGEWEIKTDGWSTAGDWGCAMVVGGCLSTVDGWLADWDMIYDWLIDWVTDWGTDWWADETVRLMDRLTGWLIVLDDWLTNTFVEWFWLKLLMSCSSWMTDCNDLTDRFQFAWLIDCLINVEIRVDAMVLIDFEVHWLIGWSFGLMIFECGCVDLNSLECSCTEIYVN